MNTSQPGKPLNQRPAELEDWLNREVYHPASWRLARLLARTPVTPNMVSLAGAMIVMLAAYFYAIPGSLIAIQIAFALHLFWHVVDGADGDLARMTGRTGPRGELVDGLCDIFGHVVLYLVLGTIASDQIGLMWGWSLACSAGASRLLQAAHYESSRRQYQLIVYGTPWLGSSSQTAARKEPANWLAGIYLAGARLVAPQARALAVAGQSQAAAARLRDGLQLQAFRLLKPMTLLSANYRTIGIGIAMLAGRPQWFFVYEAVVLNGLLVFSIVNSRRVLGRLLADQAG